MPGPAAGDAALIAEVITRLVDELMPSRPKAVAAMGISRDSLWRAEKGEALTARMYRKIETGLGLPYQALDMIGRHDFDGLRTEGIVCANCP